MKGFLLTAAVRGHWTSEVINEPYRCGGAAWCVWAGFGVGVTRLSA